MIVYGIVTWGYKHGECLSCLTCFFLPYERTACSRLLHYYYTREIFLLDM